MSWPIDPIPDDYDFAAVANIGAFWAAIAERHKILDNDSTGVVPGTALPSRAPAAGDYVIAITGSLGQQPQTATNGVAAYCINLLQKWISTNAGQFVATYIASGGVFAGASYNNAPRICFWTFGGIATADNIVAQNLAEYIGAGTNDSGYNWTRRRPAQITSSVAAAYDDTLGVAANVPTNGHTAWNTADGKKYTRTAGVWVLAADQSVALTVLSGAGEIKAGDYPVPLCWLEIQKALKQLRWTGAGSTWINRLERTGSGYDNDPLHNGHNTQAAAKAAALVLYNASEVGSSVAYVGGSSSTEDDSTDPGYPFSYAALYRSRGFADVSGVLGQAATPPISRSIEYYYLGGAAIIGFPYEDLGLGIVSGSNYVLWLTDGPDAASHVQSTVTLPLSTATPAWPTVSITGTDEPYSDAFAGSVQAGNPYVIAKWDSGLTYL